MRSDAHYSLQAALASRAGFAVETGVLAWANLQTDRCNGFGFHTQANYVSWANPWDNVGYCFHFIPGGKTPHPLMVVPNSACAWLLVRDALHSGSAIRLGMALHSFMDTFSHQRFVGALTKLNSAPSWQKGWSRFIPDYGHADYLTDPDEINITWFDSRHQERVNNNERFIVCFRAIATILNMNKDACSDIYAVMEEPSFDKRKDEWQQIANVRPYSEVQEEMWAKYKDEFKIAAAKQASIVRDYMKGS